MGDVKPVFSVTLKDDPNSINALQIRECIETAIMAAEGYHLQQPWQILQVWWGEGINRTLVYQSSIEVPVVSTVTLFFFFGLIK